MDKAFHGRTLATLSATGNRKVQQGFEPLVPGFVRVPFNDIESVRQVASHEQERRRGAGRADPGEGGINISSMRYLRDLRELCDRQAWLLMVDEVQCGLGRTGKWFRLSARRDSARMSCCSPRALPRACRSEVPRPRSSGRVFKPGTHGSTFGGNPLGLRSTLATLAAIEEEGLMKNAERIGGILLAGLREALAGRPGVAEVRGHGLMIGVELDRPCGDLSGRRWRRAC